MDYKLPDTGLILIGRKHPDWDEMVEAEKEAGNKIMKLTDGRYYSIPVPEPVEEKKPEPMPMMEDNSEKMMECMKTMMAENMEKIKKMVADMKQDIVKLNQPVAPIIEEESLMQGDNFCVEVSRDNTGFIQSLEIRKKDNLTEKDKTLWR